MLPGLVRRRKEEFEMIRWGIYSGSHDGVPIGVKVVVPVDAQTLSEIKAELDRLGFKWTPDAVKSFQRDHGLTPDGIVGRATLSTLQRRIDARAKSQATAAGGVAAPAASALPADMPLWAPALALGCVAVIGLVIAFQYRDVIAAIIHRRAPNAAAKLRSF